MPNFAKKCQIKSFLSRILRFLLISQSVCQSQPNLIWTSKTGANPSGASPVWCYAHSTDPINKRQTWLEVCDNNKHSSLLVRPMSFQEKPFGALPANVRIGWNCRKTTNVLAQQPDSIQVEPFQFVPTRLCHQMLDQGKIVRELPLQLTASKFYHQEWSQPK